MQDIPRIGTFIQAEVASVHADCVLLDKATSVLARTSFRTGQQVGLHDKLPYDFLAICTGGSYPSTLHQAGIATSIADRKSAIQVSMPARACARAPDNLACKFSCTMLAEHMEASRQVHYSRPWSMASTKT